MPLTRTGAPTLRASSEAVFVTRLEEGGRDGFRLAVKDLVDVAGTITTAGSAVVASVATPAAADADCLDGARRAGTVLVGKTNLSELAFSPVGTNPHFGSPLNPLDPSLIPGGSSSGSAVAVATGLADAAYGTDTGGSVRIPAACCGVYGLKRSAGSVSMSGVWPLAESLDSLGVLAADPARLAEGVRLLLPDLAPGTTLLGRVGRVRVRLPRLGASDPRIDAAVDAALAAAGLEVVEVELPGWAAATRAGSVILLAEAAARHGHLLRERHRLDPLVAGRLDEGCALAPEAVAAARAVGATWAEELAAAMVGLDALALPTLPAFPPKVGTASVSTLTALTRAANVAGVPALAAPIPVPGLGLPASLQLLAPRGGEAELLVLGEFFGATGS